LANFHLRFKKKKKKLKKKKNLFFFFVRAPTTDELPAAGCSSLDTVMLAELVEICLVTACSTPGCWTISHIAPLPLNSGVSGPLARQR